MGASVYPIHSLECAALKPLLPERPSEWLSITGLHTGLHYGAELRLLMGLRERRGRQRKAEFELSGSGWGLLQRPSPSASGARGGGMQP